ncbi:MAG: DUF2752 domain-containing protein [Chitinophagaceae bacterium]|nr:DUF2752 domain-containing protein [Chitinophagaceae bacterium]
MSNFLQHITTWLEAHQLPCLFKAMTHIDCPGCGLQRSAIALIRGDMMQSLHFYPALIPMLLFFTLLLLKNKFRFANRPIFIKTGMATIFITILVSYIFKLIN